MNFGAKYTYAPIIDYLSFTAAATADLSAAYKVPYYNSQQYLVMQPTGLATLGSKSWVEFALFFVGGKVSLDIIAAQLEPSFMIMYDTIQYDSVCFNIGFQYSAIEADINA